MNEITSSTMASLVVPGQSEILVKQRRELAELLGFETRNKYSIETAAGVVGFAAEQQKGILGLLMRQFLGHWRRFDIHFFDRDRRLVMVARHPFRFFFQRLEVDDASGRPVGFIQQRWGILSRRFDVGDSQGRVHFRVASPVWRFWTFPFIRQGREVAVVQKKWSGLLKEVFLDADGFRIEYKAPELSEAERALILAASVFIDLQYFEKKAD